MSTKKETAYMKEKHFHHLADLFFFNITEKNKVLIFLKPVKQKQQVKMCLNSLYIELKQRATIFLRPARDAGNACWRVPVLAANVGWSCSGGALDFQPWICCPPSLHLRCPPLHKRRYETLSNALL